MNFTNVADHVRAMKFADYQASEPLTHALAMSYRFTTETELPPDTVGIMERAAIHIEAAYHLLTVAEFIQRTAPVEPENIVEFAPRGQS